MNLSKERLELRNKLEGKLEETPSAPPKKEAKNVSKLVIPSKFLFTSFNKPEDQQPTKSLNAALSKSTGNLSASNSSKKLSALSFNSNGLQVEATRASRSSTERKLSSKSFCVLLQSSPENPQPKLIQEVDNDSLYSAVPKNTPVIVGSVRKNSLPDTSTPGELLNTIHLVRSPKPAKKEETSTVLHFNFAGKADARTKDEFSPSLRKMPSLLRSGSRCAIRVPNEVWEDEVFETSEDTKSIPVDAKESDEEDEEEIYVNIDIIRRYYDCSTRIKYGPIKKLPIPSIRYSLLRPCPTLV